jgi:hypothetical protein
MLAAGSCSGLARTAGEPGARGRPRLRRRVPRGPGASRRAPIDDPGLAALLRATGARGAVRVTDLASGAVVASAAIGRDLAAPVMSPSVIKLYLAALWWEHGLGDGDFAERGRRVIVHDVLVDGWDRPGERWRSSCAGGSAPRQCWPSCAATGSTA